MTVCFLAFPIYLTDTSAAASPGMSADTFGFNTDDEVDWGPNAGGWKVLISNDTRRPLYMWSGGLSNITFPTDNRLPPGHTYTATGNPSILGGPANIDLAIGEHNRALTPGPRIDIAVRWVNHNFDVEHVHLLCTNPAPYTCTITQGSPSQGATAARQEPIHVTIEEKP